MHFAKHVYPVEVQAAAMAATSMLTFRTLCFHNKRPAPGTKLAFHTMFHIEHVNSVELFFVAENYFNKEVLHKAWGAGSEEVVVCDGTCYYLLFFCCFSACVSSLRVLLTRFPFPH